VKDKKEKKEKKDKKDKKDKQVKKDVDKKESEMEQMHAELVELCTCVNALVAAVAAVDTVPFNLVCSDIGEAAMMLKTSLEASQLNVSSLQDEIAQSQLTLEGTKCETGNNSHMTGVDAPPKSLGLAVAAQTPNVAPMNPSNEDAPGGTPTNDSRKRKQHNATDIGVCGASLHADNCEDGTEFSNLPIDVQTDLETAASNIRKALDKESTVQGIKLFFKATDGIHTMLSATIRYGLLSPEERKKNEEDASTAAAAARLRLKHAKDTKTQKTLADFHHEVDKCNALYAPQ
jgi:hypothetical protein